MNVGIIGAGKIAGTIGDLWARAGHAILYGARDPEKARALLAGGGATIGTLADAATFGEAWAEGRRMGLGWSAESALAAHRPFAKQEANEAAGSAG